MLAPNKNSFRRSLLILAGLSIIMSTSYSQCKYRVGNDSVLIFERIVDQLPIIADPHSFQNSRFDPQNFQIRIWKNESLLKKTRLWELSCSKEEYSYRKYIYDITAYYHRGDSIIEDHYDIEMPKRLPLLGGNGVIGYNISNLEIIEFQDSAKSILDQLVTNRIFSLYSYKFSTEYDTIIDGKVFKEMIITGLGGGLDIEIFSKNFYLKYHLPALENLQPVLNLYEEYEYAKNIIAILEKY